ncbi:MAG: CHAT domain-containing protein, partial [Nannocystaceae bacterium]
RSALAATDLLHYAGHGLSDGNTGVGSVLLLAGSTLSVGDILMLPSVPQVVVLSGCETGLTDSRTLSGGMSVAWAFVAAGSQSVIAAASEIDDDLAAAISSKLYSGGDETGFDGPSALRRAQLAIRAQDPAAAWHVFRAWVP